jgi:hypothetical protein
VFGRAILPITLALHVLCVVWFGYRLEAGDLDEGLSSAP